MGELSGSLACVDALGVRVGLETSRARVAALLADAWADCAVSLGADEEPDVVLSLDLDVEGAPEVSARDQAEHLTQAVTVEAVTQRAGELLMLHACVVGDPETGTAVVLVGPSGMGKTTVARTLGKRWCYLSDETAGVTADGALVPYPKPLSVVAEGRPGKDQVAASALGLRLPGQGSWTVGAVLLLDRVAGRSGVMTDEIPTLEAVALLAEHTSFLATLEAPLHRLAELLRRAGGLRRVRYAEAVDLEPLVEDLLTGTGIAR